MKHLNHIAFSRKKALPSRRKTCLCQYLLYDALAVETPYLSVYCPHATFCIFIFERLIHESFQYVSFADFPHTYKYKK